MSDRSYSLTTGPNKTATSRKRHLFYGIKHVAIALIAFLVSVSLIYQTNTITIPPSNIPYLSSKYSYYRAHKDEYNALFFGSSRTYNHVDPNQFDRAVQAVGININSYNLGIPAMFGVEGAAFLDMVLRDPPNNLKWVFIEYGLHFTILAPPIEQRAVYWHSWKNTWLATHYLLLDEHSPENIRSTLLLHWLFFVQHQLNLGRIVNWSRIAHSFPKWEEPVASEAQGHTPIPSEVLPSRQDFLENIPTYLTNVEALKAWTTPIDKSHETVYIPENQKMLIRYMANRIKEVGAEAIFIESPTAEPPPVKLHKPYTVAHELNLVDTVLSYRDPNKYPQLYRVDQRYDKGHLNREGAIEFTRLLADDFIKINRHSHHQ